MHQTMLEYLPLRSRNVVDVVEGESMGAVRSSGTDNTPILHSMATLTLRSRFMH